MLSTLDFYCEGLLSVLVFLKNGFSHLLAVLLRPADLLLHCIHFIHYGIHLILLLSELPAQTLFEGAQLGCPLREVGELLQGKLPLGVGILQLLGLSPQTLQSVRQLLLR